MAFSLIRRNLIVLQILVTVMLILIIMANLLKQPNTCVARHEQPYACHS